MKGEFTIKPHQLKHSQRLSSGVERRKWPRRGLPFILRNPLAARQGAVPLTASFGAASCPTLLQVGGEDDGLAKSGSTVAGESHHPGL